MSAFDGYLLQIWDVKDNEWITFPTNMIFKESYVAALETQDMDSQRNASGKLVRKVLEHQVFTVTFSLKPMWSSDMDKVFKNCIHKGYSDGERKIKLKFFNIEENKYDTGNFYLATPKFTINLIKGNKIFYNATELSFIQY